MENQILNIYSISTPLEELLCGVVDNKLVLAQFSDSFKLESLLHHLISLRALKTLREESPLHKVVQSQINEYFQGERKIFDLPLDPVGTDFQKNIWKLLGNIGYGHQTTYMKLSRKKGDKKAIRAVASAIGANPINVIIPCHRVLGSDGKLTGYAGKTWRKKYLLELENGIKQQSLF